MGWGGSGRGVGWMGWGEVDGVRWGGSGVGVGWRGMSLNLVVAKK